MSELLDSAIDEIERVLIGNKDRNTEEVYLKNAIRHIREYGSQPQLNENQQVVLYWLKEEKTNSSLTAFDCIYSFIYGNPKDLVTQIWSELNEKEECQVLEAFGKWAQEQEED